MANINRVVLVGNLTRDPELRHTPSGTAVCSLRLAVNTRRKDGATGEWTEKPNYFDITVWGNQGENCAQYLSKGRPVAIDGRLEWREWEAQDGTKRQAVEVIADTVQFLGGRDERRRRWRRRQPVRARRRGDQHRRRLRRRQPTTTFRSRRRSTAWQEARDSSEQSPTAQQEAPAPTGGRRKSCFFCKSKVEEIDYKNIAELRRYISEKGKIRSRRISGACRRHQRQVAVAIKRAREMALLPYVAEGARSGPAGARRGGRAPPGRRPRRPARRGRERRPRLRAQLPAAARPRRGRDPGLSASSRSATRSGRATRRRHRRGRGDRERLEATELQFEVNAGPTGSLFGSVTATNVADRLWEEQKIRLDRRKLGLEQTIKRIGRYTVRSSLRRRTARAADARRARGRRAAPEPEDARGDRGREPVETRPRRAGRGAGGRRRGAEAAEAPEALEPRAEADETVADPARTRNSGAADEQRLSTGRCGGLWSSRTNFPRRALFVHRAVRLRTDEFLTRT